MCEILQRVLDQAHINIFHIFRFLESNKVLFDYFTKHLVIPSSLYNIKKFSPCKAYVQPESHLLNLLYLARKCY